MGMFDEVASDAVRCPLCGDHLSWQTKDADNVLAVLTPRQLMRNREQARFYSDCGKCSLWVEVSIERRHPTPVEQYSQERLDKQSPRWRPTSGRI